ncbi:MULTISPECIES: NAD-dependent epimerase/dehydratase family protein [Streptomyces]|uniref:NAD-dependent epimerase/dehydratase family protein n=2 Tax=Streptomyces TaxID=1883 RepID=A0ABU2RC28_9ACTN|nr:MULTISPECIES: NAD-dependent epimerase/dehydratase family protein [unclassified Streptomyces]MDT0412889.1 NAD-dependent epimerase/dehydratase family protein [Streptomyces sp. DSM 41979]MYQ56846.1 NAD-dependent epimerase/dehydratase family protein [Streptomyces sp. SID4926]SCE58030.1 UDP-glucose 4-epimerase [Streptomyces sp. DfronAA-171]
MGSVVLVTGAGRRLGARFVRAVQEDPAVDRVIAVDAAAPAQPLGRAQFVRADLRQPVIARVLAEHAVDTVVHLDVTGTAPGVPRAGVKETNVIGSLQLLGACQKSPWVRRLVVKSSTAVYGSAARDPAVVDEAGPHHAPPHSGFAKDVGEVENYVRGFARRRPDVAVGVLRFAGILGPGAESPFAAYFALPVLPTVLGHDPRLQFVHEDDALAVLRLLACLPESASARGNGTYNVAGEGVLLLSQCARRLGRPTVALLPPVARWAGAALRGAGLGDFSPEQWRMLTHGRVVATDRLREDLGFTPAHGTAETFADYARARGPGLLPPALVGAVVDRLAQLRTP